MKTSDTIAEIAKALSIAQSQMTGAKKGSKNPFFKNVYSNLTSVMEAISEPFANNGLCFIQSPGFTDNLITVTTRIMHTSGEWLEGTTCMPPQKNDAQGYASAITYGRRYGLQSMSGVPSVDDDGQLAAKNVASSNIPDIREPMCQIPAKPEPKATPEMVTKISKAAKEAKVDLTKILSRYNVSSLSGLTQGEANNALAKLGVAA